MAVRKFKPTTPGQRHKVIGVFKGTITATTPEKSLTVGKKASGGRNSEGHLTTRYLGGGHKRKYRIIDFKRTKDGVPAVVKSIEYDPNRSARIALLYYKDGAKAYIIAPNGLKVGDELLSGPEAQPEVGNCLPLANIPVGTLIHNIELRPGQGAFMARSAGTFAQLVSREGTYAIVKLPTPSSNYLRVKPARSSPHAALLSVLSVTQSTRSNVPVRPAVHAGSVAVPATVALL